MARERTAGRQDEELKSAWPACDGSGVIDRERATGLLRMRNRLAKVFGIAAEGVPIVGAVMALGFAVSLLGFAWPGALIIVAAFAVAAFFRDPERAQKNHEGAVISGADGKVTDIGEGCLPGGSHKERYRRGVFFICPLHRRRARPTVIGGGGFLLALP